QAKRTGLPLVCSNLIDKTAHRTLAAPYLMRKVGAVQVGVFGLIGAKPNLGPGFDSLEVRDPVATAREVTQELRRKGADVVVLLSQLGKASSEDVVSAIDGIDAVIVGHNTPMFQNGRMVKNTIACYSGEQGQYMCQTTLTLDVRRHMTTGFAESVMLGPDVGDRPELVKLVKGFEDAMTEKQHQAERKLAAETEAKTVKLSQAHYLGAGGCARCHAQQASQWRTTAHAWAWQSLVDVQADATTDCIRSHVGGSKQPGGFIDAGTSARFEDVQCESCHGMGTEHDAHGAGMPKVTEQTCRNCHDARQDPHFDYAKALAMVVHSNTSGESVRSLDSKPPRGAMMLGKAKP